jgi:hypothetical protein
MVIWHGTKARVFTVKSVYHLATKMETRDTPESTKRVEDSDFWRSLWNLKVPNTGKKIKIFLWRVCNNLLSNMDNLLRHKVTKDLWCPICGHEEGTIHILWECPSAMDIWGVGDNFSKKLTKRHGVSSYSRGIVQKVWPRKTYPFCGTCPPNMVQEDRCHSWRYIQAPK